MSNLGVAKPLSGYFLKFNVKIGAFCYVEDSFFQFPISRNTLAVYGDLSPHGGYLNLIIDFAHVP